VSLFPTTTTIATQLDAITSGSTYLALYTATPTVSGGGTEVTGGSYARKAITWGSTVGATRSNTIAISFTAMPAANITHYGIHTALTGGTLKAFGALNAPITTISGDEVVISIGSVQATVAGS